MKANLTGIPETLFVTLRARAVETMRPDAAVKDPDAVEILRQIQFDESPKNTVSNVSQTGIIVRTLIFDEIVRDFLANKQQAVVVNLGCGLDARCKRLPLGNCRWFDIDVPESIEVRRHFFEETPTYKMIATSMFADPWMDAVPKDIPVLFIAEGVMMFFPEDDIRALLCKIADRFNKAQIAFDTVSRWASRNHKRHPDLKKFDAPMRWGIDDARRIEGWRPGFKVIREYYYANYLKDRWPLAMKIVMRLYPPFMRSFRVLRISLK